MATTKRNKTLCWLSILILTGLGLSVSPHRVLTRTDEVSRALSPVLSSYEVIRMNPGEIEQQVRTTGELRFRFDGTDFYFNLEPHDMRTPNYRAVETGPGGVRRTLPTQPVHTFKGVLAGREDTRGRFNLTEGGVEGVVYAPEGWVYVEPLSRYLPDTPAGELVFYRHSDVRPGQTWKCDVSLPHRLQREISRVEAQVDATTPTQYAVEVATEADYEYVQSLGGSQEANREILGILNQVEGVYQSELLLQIQIGFQHAWTTNDDSYPYTATDFSALLSQFAAHWNANFAKSHDFDLAHIWTDLESVNRFAAGLAYLSVVCNAREVSYSLSSRPRSEGILKAPFKYVMAAHEFGHNFGAVHPNELDPPIEICDNTIMTVGWDGSHRGMTFCEFSRQQIANHLSLHNGCLVPQAIELQPPGELSAKATSKSRINLAWQDNSTNETGFVVQRRRDGSGVWIQVGTTAANVERFSDGELFSEATYLYRVQAFKDTAYSAYSNEAAATTLAGVVAKSDWVIATIAGDRKDEGDKGPATEAQLSHPRSVAVDASGNVYIADSKHHRIRRVNAGGIITTIAGTGESGFSGDSGPAVEAQLSTPSGVAVDGSDNLYIADTGNNRIRRVDAEGIITTIAGTDDGGFSGDGGPSVAATLHYPYRVVVNDSGDLYVVDAFNHRIRRVDTAGIITTIAGTWGNGFRGDGGPAVAALLRHPRDMALDGAGNLYIADAGNFRIRRVDAAGIITTVAGIGESRYGGDGGPAVEAPLYFPSAVEVDGAGDLYIADSGNFRIRRVDAAGIITTVAGTGQGFYEGGLGGYGGDGGPAVEARMHNPNDLDFDGVGNLYIADDWNHRIRRVDTAGIITTIAGIGEGGSRGDGGPAVEAGVSAPEDVAVDGAGNLYIADSGNHRIRRVDTAGTITTVAGNGEEGFSGDGGQAVAAMLKRPTGVAVDRAGNLYIADFRNHRVRRVNAAGIITTIAGTGEGGFSGDNGPAVEASLHYPFFVAVDGPGNLYISDSGNRRIRRVDIAGTITTIAGSGGFGLGGDGGPAAAAQLRLSSRSGLAVDGSGYIYIVDRFNRRIRRVDPSGTITTFAGIGIGRYSDGEGPASEAVLTDPADVTLDGAGNLYISDGNRIHRVDTRGTITAIAGTGIGGFTGDGGPALKARLNNPTGIAADRSGNVYVADMDNNRIRILTRPPAPPTRLTAKPVSSSRVKLNWQDNSTDEKGFRIERRGGGERDWVEIGTVAAGLTTFLDEGLKPLTAYHYRVEVIGIRGASATSNQATARTLAVKPLTLTGFAPNKGPVGTRVTLAGTNLFEATAVEFNGVNAHEFEIVSGTSIEAIVPQGATSGPISVVSPGGTAVSAVPFSVTTGFQSRLFVPIVLRSQGRTAGSFFTSELTLTNRGTTTAAIRYTYTAAFGGGSGSAVDSLEPGRQRVIPDAIAYLTSLGVPIGSGSAGGTLVVDFSNLSSESDAAGTVRVSTPVEEGSGRAGLAFPGLYPDGLFTGPAYIAGLRQNRQDRSNLAVQNAGVGGEESITLKVTIFSGDPEAPGSLVLPDLSLPPGGFHQYNRILTEAGFDNGYVKVERVEGAAPYYAYGVINDNFNSDGSFVFPVREDSLEGKRGQTLPVIIETKDFASELTVTNFSSVPKTVEFRFVAEAVETDDDTAGFSLSLEAGEQRILPGVVDWMREQKVEGIGAAEEAFVGAVFATVAEGDMSGIVMGARTGSPDMRGGQYSLFYNGVPNGAASTMSAWIYGLQQNEENRGNLALVNTGEVEDDDITLEIDIYDGQGDSEPSTRRVVLGPGHWHQFNGILGNRRHGYVEVRKTLGNNPFIAYGVINDGGKRGQRSGDGAFLVSQP